MDEHQAAFLAAFQRVKAGRKAVTDWMAAETRAGNLRSNGEAPSWHEYKDAQEAWGLACYNYAEYLAEQGA